MTTFEVEEAARAAYRKEHSNITLYGVDKYHVCHPQCHFWHHRNHSYVCRQSLRVHICGYQICTLGEPRREEVVCPLTGLVVGDIDLVESYNTHSAVASRPAAFRNTTRPIQTTRGNIFRNVRRAMTNVFLSDERKTLALTALQKFVNKLHPQNKPFLEIQADIWKEIVDTKTKYVIPRQICQGLPDQIAEYILRVYKKAPKNIDVVVVAILHLLRIGYVTNDICIFPKHPWVEKFMPPLLYCGKLKNIKCGSVTTEIRALKTGMVTKYGVIRMEYIWTHPV